MTAPATPPARQLPVPAFVLGPDVASAWGVPAARQFYPSEVLTRLLTIAAVVPEHWVYQVADRIRLGVTAGHITAARASHVIAGLWDMAIVVDGETRLRVATDTLALALTHSIPIESAAYLELALRLNLPLATIDPALTRAANAAGVPIFTP